ncbi:hypothetical protein RDWZM_003295 [Blomia tropicalis]|uniref:Uncharacterized protein n=1 Tax=Blomia tropicalis TaxID=40697 RepID=A0A9Q0MJA1_BLOTA|nr:hypothetical protein RDWZM_003295 [Blomia tropicalis]
MAAPLSSSNVIGQCKQPVSIIENSNLDSLIPMTSQESSTPSILSSSSSSKKARSVPQVGQFGQPMPGNHQFGPQSPAQAAIQPHVGKCERSPVSS